MPFNGAKQSRRSLSACAETMTTQDDLSWARFQVNMGRVKGLVELASTEPLKPPAPLESIGPRADLIRTIVVFLHATFEDALRTTARERLASAKSGVLKDIPLVGISESGRAEKFFLGELDGHRGKTVDQLISESVANYLDRKTFGSVNDVETILRQMELDTRPFQDIYPDLQQMMTRRHRIVHEADLRSPTDRVSAPWTFVDDLDLTVWMLAVILFYMQLRVSLEPTDEIQKWFRSRVTRGFKLARDTRAEILTIGRVPTDVAKGVLHKASVALSEVKTFLAPPTIEEFIDIWRKSKSPDDPTTDDEVRTSYTAFLGRSDDSRPRPT